MTTASLDACIRDLETAFAASQFLTGAAVGQKYQSDQSGSLGMGACPPAALIRPRNTAEVSAALRICHRHGAAVVPQGGLTGLAGGATPSPSAIAINLELMRGIEEVDAAAATITVLAGTPLEEVQQAAAAAGFFFGLDLGARGTCQIGGNLSTNAGGNRVIRYGMAREQVLGLEAVLADGTVISSLNKMLKNNAGYDLKQLFIGAEGTLGIITRAILKLQPPPGAITTALCGLARYEDVVALLRLSQRELGGIAAFEAMWRSYADFNLAALHLSPFAGPHDFLVLIESSEAPDRIEAFLAARFEDETIADAVIAQSEGQARDFWTIREGLAIDTLPHLLNFDVSLPVAEIGRFAADCNAALLARWPGAHAFFYGHIGDSNLHISVSAPYRAGESMHDVDDVVYDVLRRYKGSISAEHGIGTLKRPYLGFSRSPEELALMRSLKQALDPKGILNPGKVI